MQESANTLQRTPYRFTSKELDEETGLYYFGARYYDPRTSVWQSTDPILGEYLPIIGQTERDLPSMGGVYASANLNVFSYVAANPLVYRDPNGQERVPDMVGFVLQVFSGVDISEHYMRNENQPNPPENMGDVPSGKFDNYGTTPTHNLGGASGNVDVRGKPGTEFEGHQYIYNKDGDLVTNPLNEGSFDFSSPTKSKPDHFTDDVVPWVLWGNSPNDPSTGSDRVDALIDTMVNAVLEGPPEPVTVE